MNGLGFGQIYMNAAGIDASIPENQQQYVSRQKNPTGGTGVGFGYQFMGGEGSVDMGAAPDGSMEQTGEIGTEMASDIASTGEQPLPGQAVINDAGYSMATQGDGFEAGFTPNSLPASQQATGPMSRNLMTTRAGFGQKFS